MKKIFKNKKGFTLVELLAVIVILAIIMVIATQQIGKVIQGARADSFVESYQMIAKQVSYNIASDKTATEIACSTDCLTKYNLSSDYTLTIAGDVSSGFTITLGAAAGGKFDNMDLKVNGKAATGTACDETKIANGATSCTEKQIVGTVN